MSLDVKVDTSEFESALVRYKVGTGKSWPAVIREQSRLLLARLIQLTPPKNQAQGKQAVAGDISRVFTDFGSYKFEDKRIQKMWSTKNWQALEGIFKNSQALSRYRIVSTPEHELHRNMRGARGRVSKNARPAVLVKSKGKINHYIKEIQKRVGMAKAGWAVAMMAVGGKLPGWISRHGGRYGSVRDESQRENDPQLTMSNQATHIIGLIHENRIVEYSLQGRVRDMEKSMEVQLNVAARKAGL